MPVRVALSPAERAYSERQAEPIVTKLPPDAIEYTPEEQMEAFRREEELRKKAAIKPTRHLGLALMGVAALGLAWMAFKE